MVMVRAGFSFARGNTGKHNTTPSETRCLRQCNCQCADLYRYVCMHLNCVYISTYPHTHIPARTHTLFFSLPPPCDHSSHSASLSLAPSLSLSIFHSYTNTQTQTNAHTHLCMHTLTGTPCISHTQFFSFIHTPSRTPPLFLSLSLSHTHIHAHPPSHTHTRTHTHTLSVAHTHSLSP